MNHYAVISSPIGNLYLNFSNQTLCSLEVTHLPVSSRAEPYMAKTIAAINNYFVNPSQQFDIALAISGTTFQKKVWEALCQIPAGKTLTYGQLAKQLKTSPRAIGQACRTNPLIIVIPCHRIIAQHGLGGYSGAREGKWLSVKEWLLTHEGFLKVTHAA